MRIRKYNWIFLFLLLAACSKMPIYHDLTETEANEILVALQDRGISAHKLKEVKSQQVTWSIQVANRDASAAQKILVENNLPHKKELGFSGICKDKGLIPTPDEEKCRKVLALKGEIINSLEKIPGVIEADVVLNLPEVSEFASETQASKRPTASAVLKVKKSPEGLEITEPKAQRFISNSVENLDPRDVSVVITYIQSPDDVNKQGGVASKLVSIAGLRMDIPSKDTFKIYALSVLILLLGVSVALVFTLLKLTSLRRQLGASGQDFSVNQAQDPNHLLSGPDGAAMNPSQIPAAGQTGPK